MRVVKTRKAYSDLIEFGEYIAEDNTEIADRFFDSFDETIEKLAKSPKIGTIKKVTGISNLRMWFVKGFENCLIFYLESPEEVTIVRIIHSSRDYPRFFDLD
jgi:toxin ParE1/3/4